MARFLVAAVLVGSTAALAGPSSSNFLRRRLYSTSGAPVGRTAAALPRTQADMQPRLVAPSGGAGVGAITADDVATLPRPGTTVPGSMAFSPDGRYLTYLLAPDAATLTRRLFSRDVASGATVELMAPDKGKGEEATFSEAEKLRRERARVMHTGVTSFKWAGAGSNGHTLLVPLDGALWVLDHANGQAAPRCVAREGLGGLPLGEPLLDPQISADASTVAFVCGSDVWAVDAQVVAAASAGGVVEPTLPRARQVTSGSGGTTRGLADFLAQEELDRYEGFWLSPAGNQVAFEEVDEQHVPLYTIVRQGGGDAERGASEQHRYPFAGEANPVVKVGVAASSSSAELGRPSPVTWFDLDAACAACFGPFAPPPVACSRGGAAAVGNDWYLGRCEWLPGGDALIAQVLDRRQEAVAVLRLDCAVDAADRRGAVAVLLVERAPAGGWVNLHACFRLLPAPPGSGGGPPGREFLWRSERDGHGHLYAASLQPLAGQRLAAGVAALEPGGVACSGPLRRLTGPGAFDVEEVAGLHNNQVYYMGTAEGRWCERHLFQAPLFAPGLGRDGRHPAAPPTCLTAHQPGYHHCVLHAPPKPNLLDRAPRLAAPCVVVDTHSTVAQPPTVDLCTLGLGVVATRHRVFDAAAADPRVAHLGLAADASAAPQLHTFASADGQATLQAAVYLPDSAVHGPGPWPTLVSCYGGPHVQFVSNQWSLTADLRAQFLRAQGFLVLKVDNRGSHRRGLAFEQPVRKRLGTVEVDDQVAGVAWAVRAGWANPRRVAIAGWSYGGYLSAMCLATAPATFHAAVCGAPVTDWRLYDTAYTERYMGLPQENPEGYAAGACLPHVGRVQGSLLLCHGLMDENVLFRHSGVLIDGLVSARKRHELLLFPSERHGPRRPTDRAFLEERILAFLQDSLGHTAASEPPAE